MHLGQQKLQLDDAARYIEVKINKLKQDRNILLRAIDAIDNDKENILEGNSILATGAREIMRGLVRES